MEQKSSPLFGGNLSNYLEPSDESNKLINKTIQLTDSLNELHKLTDWESINLNNLSNDINNNNSSPVVENSTNEELKNTSFFISNTIKPSALEIEREENKKLRKEIESLYSKLSQQKQLELKLKQTIEQVTLESNESNLTLTRINEELRQENKKLVEDFENICGELEVQIRRNEELFREVRNLRGELGKYSEQVGYLQNTMNKYIDTAADGSDAHHNNNNHLDNENDYKRRHSSFSSRNNNAINSLNDNPRAFSASPSNNQYPISNRIDSLEHQLFHLNQEKEQLESEFRKFPLTGGSLSTKRRKQQVESRIDQLEQEIYSIKLQLRSLHVI